MLNTKGLKNAVRAMNPSLCRGRKRTKIWSASKVHKTGNYVTVVRDYSRVTPSGRPCTVYLGTYASLEEAQKAGIDAQTLVPNFS